ncbi:Gfo/Idh/MocA family oxidoreductase [Schlesneria paludicola]|uniref:hypothetical protein n=1 Tax=Schlesneria paludicola TaxID=360056 RepID=UPI00029A2DF4|nr:hypothetical protein [Schlesneria paludicola]
MRFAVLCDDPTARPLVEALDSRIDGHQLRYVVQLGPKTSQPHQGLKSATIVSRWEDLLAANDVDVVLAGGNTEQMFEGVKQLATAGIPILFVPHASQGSTFIYELSLIRDDNHVALIPFLWHRFDAAAQHLKQLLRDGALGTIQFLQLERSVSQSPSSSPIAQAAVDLELLPDADLLRWLVGDYNQITALRTAATDQGVMMARVVLSGRSLPEANWVIAPAVRPAEWKLTVHGERGTALLSRADGATSFVCDFDGQHVEGHSHTTASGLLTAMESLIQRRDPSTTAAADDPWGDLVQCFETVDATHRSVRRKRTIELHFEPMSERAIFKTQMTAIGCGLLVATFLLTLCYLGIASVVPLPRGILIALRALVFAPLVIFLAAQILLPLTRPSSNDHPTPQPKV